MIVSLVWLFLCFKQKTAYEMRISDWSSDVCSSDLTLAFLHARFWQSSRFESDLKWVETHVSGGVADMMNGVAPTYIQQEIDGENFKRELEIGRASCRERVCQYV